MRAYMLLAILSIACIHQQDRPSPSEPRRDKTAEFVKELSSVDRDSRIRAAERLAGLGIEAMPAAAALGKASHQDPEPEVRAWAVVALGQLGPKYVPLLVRALKDKEWVVRQSAARVLRGHTPSGGEAVRALQDALQDSNNVVRVASAGTLIEIGANSAEVFAVLVDIARRPDWFGLARIEAIETLGQVGIQAVPTLIELLKEERIDVKTAAANALGRIGPAASSAIPFLLETLQDKDDEVRASADAALARIRR